MRWTGWSVLVVFLLVLFTSVALIFPVVQTWMAQQASSLVARELGVEVRVARLAVRPFGPIRLAGVYIGDLHGDTLLAADVLVIRGLRVHPRSHKLRVGLVDLQGARFALGISEGERTSNLTQVLDRLSSTETSGAAAPWTIDATQLNVRSLHFSFHDGNQVPDTFGVDLRHVDVRRADLRVRNVAVAGDSVLAMLDHVVLREQSGFAVEDLTGAARVSSRGIRIDGMDLRTARSHVRGKLAFNSSGWRAYDDFTDSVELHLDLDSSRLQLADIALFAKQWQGIDLPLSISGSFRGMVSEFKARNVRLYFGERSHFIGNADLSGLPDIATTFIVLDISELRADQLDLSALPVPPFTSGATLELPREVLRLGDLGFTGNFTGFPNAFTAYGRATTDPGVVRTDMTFERDTTSGEFQFTGKLASTGFDLGILAGDRTVGPLACNVRVKAHGRNLATLKGDIEGTVPLLTFNNQQITNITINGQLEKKRFNGELQCRDPRLDMDFRGLADLRGRWPRVDLTADIRHADLKALDLVDDPGYNSLNMRVMAQGELAPDSLKGNLVLEDVSYCVGTVEYDLGDIELRSMREGGEPVVQLRSTLADATVRGPFLPTLLPGALRSVVFSVFPALQEQVDYTQAEQRFTFETTIKEADPALAMLLPGLELAPGATASGSFDSRTFDLSLTALIPHIAYGEFAGDSVRVTADKTMDVLAFSFRSARQALNDSTYISGIDITGKAYQDEVEVSMGWSGSSVGTSGELELQGLVKGPNSMDIDLLPSQLFFGRGTWSNTTIAQLSLDSTVIHVKDLELWNNGQRIRLDGTVSKDPADSLAFELTAVRLENIEPFIGGPTLRGSINGDGRLFDLWRSPYMISYLSVDTLMVNDRLVGDLRSSATWNNENRFIDLIGSLERDTIQAFTFTGRLAPGQAEELDVQLRMDHFDLAFLEAYLPDGISEIQGLVTGTIDVNGRLAEPLISGSALLENAGLRVNYLNTSYRFTHQVNILPDMFTLDLVKLHDEYGNTATAVGTIAHRGLSDWNFDVTVAMDRFLCLNTTEVQNELYFGRAFATGDFQVSGFADNLEISVNARTERGTQIQFPLGGGTDIGDIGFVRFINAEALEDQIEQEIDLSGIELNMNVEVTPEARFDLIFDPTVGDILSGRGRGHVRMQVTPGGEFSMKGGLEVTDGDYLFTLRNVVNKRFEIEPGGTITWYGDPFNATLDLEAVYRLRTALYDIMRERNDAYRKRVPVDVVMHLSERLMNPTISFQIRLPSVDESVRTEVNSQISTEQEMNRQVFALIVLNKFLPRLDAGADEPSAGSSVLPTTGSELLSNQVSNWLSGISNDFDLGFNYRPGNSISQDEVEVAVSTQLFNERVEVSTNVGVQYGTGAAQQSNTLVGDFQAEVLLTQDGKLRLKAYSQSNDRNLVQVDQATTTQGVGLAWREEFNDLSEFWRSLRNIFRSKSKRQVKESDETEEVP